MKKKLSLPIKILIGLVLGAITGFIFKDKVAVIEPIGTVFLRLLRMTIIPLVFFSIVSGVSGFSDLSRLKKVGFTFIRYWALSSLAAASVGTLFALIMKPGVGITLPNTEAMEVNVDLIQSFVEWIPDNVFVAFTEFNMIQIIVFALFTGISITLLSSTKAGQLMNDFVQSAADLMGKMVSIVLKFAPFGVFALMANVTGTVGGMALVGIGKMLVTQYIAYAFIIVVVYAIILKVFANVNPVQHYRNVFPAMVMAFTTQSSSATIPVTMECTSKRSGVPEDIVNLITAPAATINMHAVSAEMPIYALFAAQIYGITLSPLEFIQIIVLGVILAAGCAGVPGGGIMMSAILLEIMGLPYDIVPWIAGIYVLIDMPNTMINVTGDTVGMVYTAHKLGELDREVFDAAKDTTTESQKEDTAE
ncbi:MAG: dicarboxylate/amino acid:cation symporter [Tissierellaceae bacterium]|jgi:Na+/H+-dicarboxylate symporter